MILAITRMKVPYEKRMELSQAITSLSGDIRMEKGCRRCDLCRIIDDEDRLFLLEEWATRKNLMAHLKSEHFRVLRGAMNLLKEPYEMIFHTVVHPMEMGEISEDRMIRLRGSMMHRLRKVKETTTIEKGRHDR